MELDELYLTAKLAKLDLGKKEAEILGHEVSRMLEYFSVMEMVSVDGLNATVQPLGQENVTRPDSVSYVNVTEKIISNAPESEGRFIIIPNVL